VRILKPQVNLDEFLRKWRRAPSKLVLLDYDGTLAPFHIQRDKALPYPGVTSRIRHLMGMPGIRVVVISGREAREVLRLLGLKPHPEIWGAHGRQRLYPDGRIESLSLTSEQEDALSKVRNLARDMGWEKHIEEKPGCLALHTRGIEPEKARKIQDEFKRESQDVIHLAHLCLHPFDGGIEVRAPDIDKGLAVKALLNEVDRNAQVVYLGDDLTDEDAFKALSGRGLRVLVRTELRPTGADIWIRPPDELLQFLELLGKGGEDGGTCKQTGSCLKPPSNSSSP